jgi:hypothetical protein
VRRRTFLVQSQSDVSTSVATGGTTNTVCKFTGGFTIGDSSITDNGTTVSITTGATFIQGSATTPAISHTSSTSTGIFWTDQGGLGISTDGTQAIAWDTSQNATMAGDLTFGTSPTIDATTSQIRAIGGTDLETLTVGGPAYVRTSGNLVSSLITATSGTSQFRAEGFSTNTNVGDPSTTGGFLTLRNLSNTDGNFSAVVGANSAGPTTNGIVFIQDSQSANTGSVALVSRGAGVNPAIGLVINPDQYNVVTTSDSVIADGELSAGTSSISVDEANNSLVFKVKYSNGTTILTTSIGLS